MAYMFPSVEWVAQLQHEVNNSAAYASSGKTWEGDFYFIIQHEGGPVPEQRMYLDLWHGKCREAHLVTGPESITPEFTITGTTKTFRKIFEKKLDPIQALMTKQLKLQGNMMKIMRSVKATLDLVNCCSLIDTVYPDAQPAKQ